MDMSRKDLEKCTKDELHELFKEKIETILLSFTSALRDLSKEIKSEELLCEFIHNWVECNSKKW